MPDPQRKPYSLFQVNQEVNYNRVGKTVYAKGLDGTNQQSDSIEANLLLDILRELRKQKK